MPTLTLVFCDDGAGPLTGSVALVNEFETVKLTTFSAPAARSAYGLDVASAVTPAGRVRLTSPLCAVPDQLCTTTGSVNVSPTPVVWIAAERPRRFAAGAVS